MNPNSIMIKSNITIKILIHLFLWGLIFFLHYILISNYAIEFDVIYQLSVISIYALIFYVTFYFIMPFLFKKRIILFLVFSLTIITSLFFLKEELSRNRFEKLKAEGTNLPFFRPDLMPDNPTMRPFIYGADRRPREYIRPRGMIGGKLMFNVLGLILVYAFAVSFRFIEKWRNDEKHRAVLENEKIKTELLFLKQQVNPHFLFNSLNSIYSLALNKSDVVTSSILKLSSILRYMLYDSGDSQVSLHKELEFIQDYIDLQRLRLTEKVLVNYKIIGEPEDYKIEPFIIIPLIENAFKFGTDNINQTFIIILINILHERIEIKVTNKIVTKADENKNQSGIGINNIKRRLELLYPNKHKFTVDKENDVFTVNLAIKLNK